MQGRHVAVRGRATGFDFLASGIKLLDMGFECGPAWQSCLAGDNQLRVRQFDLACVQACGAGMCGDKAGQCLFVAGADVVAQTLGQPPLAVEIERKIGFAEQRKGMRIAHVMCHRDPRTRLSSSVRISGSSGNRMVWAQACPVPNGVEIFPRTGGPAMGLRKLLVSRHGGVNSGALNQKRPGMTGPLDF